MGHELAKRMKGYPEPVISFKPAINENHHGEMKKFTSEEISSMLLVCMKQMVEVTSDRASRMLLSVPGCRRTLTTPSGKRSKMPATPINITVYSIEVTVSGRRQVAERRYSELERLHKHLKKVMRTPDFPPKRILKYNPKVLEQRRVGLQTYLQQLTQAENIPKALLRFFNINFPTATGSFDSLDVFEHASLTTHQPLIAFGVDPYLHSSHNATVMPDIVVEGVLQSLYSNTPPPSAS